MQESQSPFCQKVGLHTKEYSLPASKMGFQDDVKMLLHPQTPRHMINKVLALLLYYYENLAEP